MVVKFDRQKVTKASLFRLALSTRQPVRIRTVFSSSYAKHVCKKIYTTMILLCEIEVRRLVAFLRTL